jgi:tetratricopeptide (TPR) repeat protein
MIKAVSVSLGFVLILAGTLTSPAQTNSPASMAVSEAVLRQANTIVLRQKLVQAKGAMMQGNVVAAAKLYEDAYALVQQIGSGIPAETSQTISGLVAARLELAREAQSAGRLHEADLQVTRALKVAPQDPAVLAFKKQNDRRIAALRGKEPDEATLQQVSIITNAMTDANTLVRDGKVLYETGKFEEAEAKLEQALQLDPANEGAFYYLNLVKQGIYAREERMHTVDNATRIVQVAKAWESPRNIGLPVPNPYATTNLIHTGPGREATMSKLNRIWLDRVAYDGLPLSEVVRDLSEKAKLRDPDKTGINFLINPNMDNSAAMTTAATANPGGFGGGPPPVYSAAQINPATGLTTTTGAAVGSEPVDVNSVIIRINPPLYNVRLADVLDAIVQVADHPIKYSILDYAVVFSAKGSQAPELYSRTFKIDPNTFVQGLESVGSYVFVNNNSSSGSSSSSSSGGNGQNTTVGLLAVVNAAPGSAGSRSSGTGGGGGGGTGQGAGSGGLDFVTQTNNMVDVSVAARTFFSTLGVNLDPPKSLFFNDRLGLLFVRATMQDLDTIESALQALNQVAPEVHIKTRFIQVEQDDSRGLGFDWYLGQYNLGSGVVAQGGNAGSVGVPTSSANPQGTFPGNLFNSTTIPSGVQSLTSGLNNGNTPAIATLTGILTNPNFQVVLHALEQRAGYEELDSPEATTVSGRQTEMRATVIQTVITGFTFQQGSAPVTSGAVTTTP